MITKQKKLDKIEIVGDFKIIQVREVTEIIEDGKVISSSFHRSSFSPVQDIANERAEIQSIANIFWTKKIKTDFKKHLEKSIGF